MNRKKDDPASDMPQVAPFPQGADTSELVSGGPEDLMVQDLGGTRPLEAHEVPHYYDVTPAGEGPTPSAESLAPAGSGIAWRSISLGASAILFPALTARVGGIASPAWWIRLNGARAILTGAGLINARITGPWMWARVAGDALGLLTLLGGRRTGALRKLTALAALAYVTRSDVKAALAATATPPGAGSVDLPDSMVHLEDSNAQPV
jgi:hypothetical protein